MPIWGELLVAAVLVVAIAGTVVPVLPGALLAAAAIGIWAWLESGTGAWVVAGLCAAVLVIGQILKLVVPGRTIRSATVPWTVIAAGTAAAVLGFFVVPLIGLPLGFVTGVWLATTVRSGTTTGSWTTTQAALTAIGLATLVEAGSVVWASLIWLAGVAVLTAT